MRVNERTGEQVDYDDLVKGTEVSDGYVIIEPEELEEIAPGRSRLIEIAEFVDGSEIDPSFYRRTHYLAPDDDDAKKAYGLLRDALADTGKVAIASFVMRGQQYLAAIRASEQTIILDTLYYADEVRAPGEQLPRLPKRDGSGKRERQTAVELIDSMTGTWDPAEFTDAYRERVDELVESKRKGKQVVEEGEPPESTNVVDLMEALQRSVSEAHGGKPEKELSELSKKELDAAARELDVAGRSKLNRRELERAVGAARRSAGSKAS